MREVLHKELQEVSVAIGDHMISNDNLYSIIDTCLMAFKEEFKTIAEYTENPVEDNGELIDASFYRIYKGEFDKLMAK